MPYSYNVHTRKLDKTNRTGFYKNAFWDDIKFPAIGRNIDVASGRIDYNYNELGIEYQDNARYPNEVVGMICQMQHSWKLGSDLFPHIHWIQNQDETVNWLLEYRVYENGTEVPGAWTSVASTPVFTYVSGDLLQINRFPSIDMSSIDSVSCFIDFKLYRDVNNTSTLFAGNDLYTGSSLFKEFDVHFEIDSAGSREEYTK